MSGLPVQPAHQLPERPEGRRWLIEGLWGEEAVGIVGGEPKCCKSFLALDMAVAVASGTACLGRFPAVGSGRVLLFAAEDALWMVHQRLQGICAATGLSLAALDVQVITAPTVRLDLAEDRRRLAETVTAMKPRLLVLDPFVRLHRIDENVSAEVAPLLAFLRDLQRAHHVAVVLVHHAKKGAGKARDGQSLRGSSEFHAWGDSNLYLRRQGDDLTLATEHRAAPSIGGIHLRLKSTPENIALVVAPEATAKPSGVQATAETLDHRVERLLIESGQPLTHEELRRRCCLRAATLTAVLGALQQRGTVVKGPAGYAARTTSPGNIPHGG